MLSSPVQKKKNQTMAVRVDTKFNTKERSGFDLDTKMDEINPIKYNKDYTGLQTTRNRARNREIGEI